MPFNPKTVSLIFHPKYDTYDRVKNMYGIVGKTLNLLTIGLIGVSKERKPATLCLS